MKANRTPGKQTSGFGAGVLTNTEQEAAQAGSLKRRLTGRLTGPWALFVIVALGYAVYELMAR